MSEFAFYSVMTILAVIAGPVLAVIVTRIVDDQRADRARRMEIFRTLMRTRNINLSADHVSALNLVELEFSTHPKVIAAWKTYHKNLSEPFPTADAVRQDAATRHRASLLTKLISEIAIALRFKVEQLDILAGNYIPQDWVDVDVEQRQVRRALLYVLSGQTPIAVRPAANPYPPPPPTAPQVDQH